jgi:glycosyltransferase involved in cell wall biosynthesis
MKLSICCITYNHSKFVEQALQSFLQQVTNFDFEIIVSDDLSPDGTAEIIESIVAQHPHRINFLKNEINIGMIPNFKKALRACKGEYIALCESDDFWTDAYKLQRQVDFLDRNRQYVGCFHNAEERYEDDDNAASFLYCKYPVARSLSFHDMSYGNLMPTCSVVFRNNLFGDFPQWYDELKMGDWPLHLLNAQFGDFWYIPKVMAVHRLHKQSVWMLQDTDKNIQYTIDAYNTMIKGFDHNVAYSEQLIKAREFYIHATKPATKTTEFKRKLKHFVAKTIEKL